MKQEYFNSEMLKVIEETVHSERDRLLLKRRFIDGICIEPLSEELDLSPRQVQRIIGKYEPTLYKYLKRLT